MLSIYNTPSSEHVAAARKIAKSFGVKKCRKFSHYVYIGSQVEGVAKEVAHTLMDTLKAEGFHIDSEGTCRQLADAGLFDVCMVAKLV